MRKNLKLVIPIVSFLLVFIILAQPVAAACTGLSGQDIFIWPGAPVGEQPPLGDNYDTMGLRADRACSPLLGCGPLQYSYVQFNLTGVSEIVQTATITLTTTSVNRSNSGNLTFSFYEMTDDDTWSQFSLPWNHNQSTGSPAIVGNPGSPLGTVTANLTAAGQQIVFSNAALAAYLDGERFIGNGGDNVATVAFAQTDGPSTGQALVTFADNENADPLIRPSAGCWNPTAVNLLDAGISTVSNSLTVIYLFTIMLVLATISLLWLRSRRKELTAPSQEDTFNS